MTLSNVLEHIDCRARFLRDLLTSLKSNNQSNKLILLIRVPLIERDWVACYKRYLGLDYRLDSTHFIEYTLEELLQELHQASLSVRTLDVRFGEAFVECECI